MTRLRLIGTSVLMATFMVVLLVSGGVLAIGPTHAAPRYQDLELLTSVLSHVREHYVKEVDETQLIEGALKGMLDTLDPHSSYMSKDLYQEVQRDTKGEFEGLGIEITQRDGYVTVVAPIDNTPAALAGLRARDQIVAVCPEATEESCKSTQDMNLLEAVKLMRGPRGTKIMIQVMRAGWEAPRPFVIKRDAIRVSSVRAHLIDGEIPYIRISQFQERTASDLQAAIDGLHRNNSVDFKGMVLDLRDNPGGLLEQAVRVADMFLEKGMIVFSEGRSGGNRMEWHASDDGNEPAYPIVVLVNGGSASASEIVAGALQDHKRGLVLGLETFGKGSVQTIIPLTDGSGLRLTTALYYLPSGRSIQEVRIQPDVAVEPYTDAELKALDEVEKRPSFGEADLERHLKQNVPPKPEANPPAGEQTPPESPEERFREQLRRDRQLSHAAELLKSWTIFSKLELEKGA
jgi:carboxyl-terminal processing protease